MSQDESTTVSTHYEGSAGEIYSAWQRRMSTALADVAARKFRRFVCPSDVVLDYGCGNGAILSALEVRERLGMEPNPASRLHGASNVTFYASPEEVASQSVDVLISHHALEHSRDPFQELCQMRRILKQGGRLVLIVPIDDWRRERRYNPGDHNRHLFTWTPLLLGHLLDEVGFDVRSASIISRAWPPGSRILSRILPWPIFDAICAVWSPIVKTREIRAVALPRA